MDGHIVPQVYQKQWHTSLGENNVFYFDKNDLSSPLNKQGGNVKKHFQRKDEYIITEIDREFGIDADAKELESSLDKLFENHWNSVIESDLFTFLKETQRVPEYVNAIAAATLRGSKFESFLLEYIIIQFIRVYENFRELDKGYVDMLLRLSYSFLKQKGLHITDDDLNELIANQDYKKAIWKGILIDCIKENNSFLELTRDGLSNCNLTFIKINEGIESKFVLSDNPVIWNVNSLIIDNNLPNGVFFAVTPNFMVAYLNYDNPLIKRGDALSIECNESFVRHMNFLLSKSCLSQIGYMEDDVKKHIAEASNIKHIWESMFV